MWKRYIFKFKTDHNPETGFPVINLSAGERSEPIDTFTPADGRTISGERLNAFMDDYWLTQTPRGQAIQAYIDSEGPMPEPLFTVVGNIGENCANIYLGTSEVEVTDTEPAAGTLLAFFDQL